MPKYDVTLQALVNVRVANVEAPTRVAAIDVAEKSVNLYDLFRRDNPAAGIAFTEYAEDIHEVLVDIIGDEESKQSLWYFWDSKKWVLSPTGGEADLHLLDARAREIRQSLGYSQPGEDIASYQIDFDKQVLVTADGYGGASLNRVQGNYPVDYLTLDSKEFPTELAACEAADEEYGEDDEESEQENDNGKD